MLTFPPSELQAGSISSVRWDIDPTYFLSGLGRRLRNLNFATSQIKVNTIPVGEWTRDF